MTAAAPWSVKGIDPKAREVAKELARRSGMTLGEWLNRIILEDDLPEEITSEEHFTARPVRAAPEPPKSIMSVATTNPRPDDLGRIAFALDRLTDRIEASETRTGLAISGVEHSVRHAMARIETAEREHSAVAARFEATAEQLAAEQATAADRMRWVEAELSGPRSAEALKAIEASITRLEGQLSDGADQTHSTLAKLEERLTRAEGQDPAAIIEEIVSSLAQRLAHAEGRTGKALDSLRDSLVQLDQRMYAADSSVRGDLDNRLEALADLLGARVDDARKEIADRLADTGIDQLDVRLGQIGDQLGRRIDGVSADMDDRLGAMGVDRVEARLDQMTEAMAAVEQRSARAIENMGREVLTMAETLNRRVQSAEQRSAQAIEQVGGEIARIAGAVENRLGRTDQLHAEALERLGAEIGRITDRLTDRIIQSERRAAQAIDDVGEQVSQVTERIEQRHERAASDLAERIRQSEERTARLLESARDRLEVDALDRPATGDRSAPNARRDTVDVGLTSGSALFGAELLSRAEPVNQPALDPGNPAFDEEDFAHVYAFAPTDDFAPLSEVEDDGGLSLVPPETADEAPALSTREVIEQARAVARAAATSRPKAVQAGERRPRAPRSGLLGALKPGRPTSTWQTALLVAGGAAFLSVGAAGVVLMEGAGTPRHDNQAFAGSPRAAVALEPQVATPPPAASKAIPQVASADVGAQAPEPSDPDYVQVATAVEKKRPGALAQLKTLAEGGNPQAQMFLAKLYEDGRDGVAQSLGEARRWTARAADAGDPTAMHNLALFYFRGEAGPQDVAVAGQWFKKAADRGVVDSQYNLGLLYLSGSGVPRDLAQAYKWFRIAANGGDGEARARAMDLQTKLPAAQLATAETQAKSFEPGAAAPSGQAPATALSVLAAQKVLGRLGYYKGRADGNETHDLKLAVGAYQRDQGMAATGALDPATVARLSIFSR